MARRRLWRNHVVSLYWRTRHPLRRFLCLHEAVTLPFVVAIFWPKLTFCDHPFALRRLPQWNFVLLAVKCHGVSPLSTAVRAFHRSRKCIKCLGFSHACDAVYGTSKCKICEDFHLIILRSRLVRRNLPFFPVAPQAPPQPLVKPRPGVRMSSSRRWRVSRQASPVPQRCTFQAWKEEAAIFQRSASRDLQILEAAIFLPPY